MPQTPIQSQSQAFSTNVNVKYLWSTFLGECEDPVLGAWVDPLTVDMHLLINARKSMTPVQMTDKQKITTLSYQLYGTTSMWAILLLLNGYMHPDEIPDGAVLLAPSLSSIDAIKSSKESTSNVGKTFVV